jgi:hypothetical protein
MSDKLIKKLNDRISSNKTAIGFIEAEIPKYEETINDYSEITNPTENKIISVASSINSLQQQIVSIATSAFNVGCGTTVGASIVYPDTVKTHNENVTSSSYDGLDPFGGKTSSVLSSSNVGIGTFLSFTQNDSSQAGLGTLYGTMEACFRIPCFISTCITFSSQITSLQSQIVTLRNQLPSEITKVNDVRTEKRNSEIERYGQKRGVASLKERNAEMESAINTIINISSVGIGTTASTPPNGYPAIVIDASLKLYYDADANNTLTQPETPGTGGKWKDITGRGFDGTITNATYDSTSPEFFNFNGVDTSVATSGGIDLYDTSTGTEISVESWVNADTFESGDGDTSQWILGGGATGLHYDLVFDLGRARGRVGGSGEYAFSGTLNTGRWYHLVFTYTSQRYVRIYVDASQAGIYDWGSGLGPTISKNGVVKLGEYAGANSFNLDGKIGETRIYNRALTPTEITQNYNATKARYE